MISVIVPVYKVEKYLARCVDSILAQTYRDLEVILVDDGSPDRCGEMCDAYAEKDARVRVIHKPNGGISDTRNTGIEAAEGDFISFVDSDDYIEPKMLQTLYELQQKADADIVCCGICDRYESGDFLAVSDRKIINCSGEDALAYTLEGKYSAGSLCNKIIRRRILSGLRFLNGKIYEDAFFMPGLLFAAQTVVITTEPLYNYWHRSGSITTASFEKKHMDIIEAYEMTLDFVKKNCPDLEEVARFRVCWANFVVLDRLLQVENYKQYPEYQQVVAYLKKNAGFIMRCRYFQKTRRIAAAALKMHAGLYRLLSKAHSKRVEVFQ